jgi:hypothetical protein
MTTLEYWVVRVAYLVEGAAGVAGLAAMVLVPWILLIGFVSCWLWRRSKYSKLRSAVRRLLDDVNSRYPDKNPREWSCPYMQALDDMTHT